jgi:peptidoglycan hydrolase-like protein with peptidoglycan-binding domain
MSGLVAKASDLNSANLSSKKLLRALGVLLLACAATVGPMGAQPQSQPSSKTKPGKGSHRKSKRSRVASWRRGQQKADAQRAREIQEALIREHYLKGEPTGRWDEATQKAMQRYQAANGWQTKTVPDSRALIKLGLGPSHEHLLNPESAMTTALQERSASTTPTPAESSHSPHQK